MSQPLSPLQRHHYLLRRLHSLTGIVPIGVFLIVHLITNSSIAWGKFGLRGEHESLGFAEGGAYYFQQEVTWINEQVPHLFLIELTLWASIAFHSILGVLYARSGQRNTSAYAYGGNRRYALQRLSGYIGIFFIFYHVATLRWGWSWLVPGGAEWSHRAASSTLALALRGGTEFTRAGLAVSLFYMLGVSMLVFHFANGLWTAAITWGLTISARAQQRFGYVCAAVGVVLMASAWASVIGFVMLNQGQTEAMERRFQKEQGHALLVPDKSGTQAPAPAESR